MRRIDKNSKYFLFVKKGTLVLENVLTMLGPIIIAPIWANMSISLALIAAGISTLLFYFITNKKIPIFLGSSFFLLPVLIAIVDGSGYEKYTEGWQAAMATVWVGLIVVGLMCVIFSFIIKHKGVDKIKKIFPPVVIGSITTLLGFVLIIPLFYKSIILPSYVRSQPLWKHYSAFIITGLVVILASLVMPKKKSARLTSIFIGIIVGYLYSIVVDLAPLKGVFSSSDIVIFQSLKEEFSFYLGFKHASFAQYVTAILMTVPMAIVSFMKHIDDMEKLGVVYNKDSSDEPTMFKVVLGEGVARFGSAILAGPGITLYNESEFALDAPQKETSKIFLLSALCICVLGFFSIFSQVLNTIPLSVIGGASIVLFGSISISGVKILAGSNVDFSKTKNVIIMIVILSLGLTLSVMTVLGDVLRGTMIRSLVVEDNDWHSIKDFSDTLKLKVGALDLSPLAIVTVVGVILNLIIIDKKADVDETTILNSENEENKDIADDIK